MNVDVEGIVAPIVDELGKAWNAGDSAAFARPFADEADFVNIRGEYLRGRDTIAKGHQAIFDTIYKGSSVLLEVTGKRAIATGVVLAHVKSTLNIPTGPLAGELRALFTLVLVQGPHGWQIAAFHNTKVA